MDVSPKAFETDADDDTLGDVTLAVHVCGLSVDAGVADETSEVDEEDEHLCGGVG